MNLHEFSAAYASVINQALQGGQVPPAVIMMQLEMTKAQLVQLALRQAALEPKAIIPANGRLPNIRG